MATVLPVSRPTLALPRLGRRRRWLIRLGFLALMLVAGAWFTPTIVATTQLRNTIARDALTDLNGSVAIGSASFGWFSPVELHDVTFTDAQGRTVLTAAKVTSSKSLIGSLRDQSDLGEFIIERPVVEIVCEKGSTNIEDVLANLLKGDSSPSSRARLAVQVRVTGGRVTIRDVDANRVWEFESVDATVGVPAPRSEPLTVKVKATVAGSAPGKLDASLVLGESGSATVVATDFPLASLAPLLQRAIAGVSVAGALTSDVKVAWGNTPQGLPTVRVDGSVSARDLDVSGPPLGGDRLQLKSVALPIKLETTGRAIRIDQADLTCDVGTLSAVGSYDPAESLDRLFDRPGVKLEANIDLARLAALVPKLLRVRDGTDVRDGKLAVKLASRTTPAGTVWDGEVRAAGLKGERDGKPLEWAEPLSLEFTGRSPPGHLPTFEKFICRSDFVAINAAGSPESFEAAANIYLDRLTTRLGEFVNLQGLSLAGEASAWVIASRSPAGAFQVDAGSELKDFAYTTPGRNPLREKSLVLKATAAGLWVAHGPVRLDSGSANVTAGPDSLDLKVVEPIPDARQLSGGQLSVQLTGDIDRWVGRAGTFVSTPPGYVFGGSTTTTGTVRLSASAIMVDKLVLGIAKARFRGAGLDLDEPALDMMGDLKIDSATGSAEVTNLRITSPTLTLTEGKLTVESAANSALLIAGNGQAVADLNHLGRLFKLQTDPAGSDALHGRGTGSIRFRTQGDSTTFGGTLDIKDFAYGDPAVTGIAEPTLKLEVDARYEGAADTLTLARACVERPGLSVDAKGSFAHLSTTQDLAIDGQFGYDFAALTPELRAAFGGGFQATGKASRPFSLRGQLSPAGTLTATVGAPATAPNALGVIAVDAGIGWERVAAYGFEMGPGELTVKLFRGAGTFSPIQATFGGGKVTLTPALRLDPAPAELSFVRGKVVERAKLTPAVCSSALGYALPVIANATQAEGELSMTLDDNRFPLSDFTKAAARGQILIHRAKVGGGPIVTEIVKLLGPSSAEITLANELTVPVRIENGRVYHENLTLTVNGYAIKTSGSVGFDGTLAMVADVPIPGSFPGLKNSPVLKKALEGKIVKVPVTGTMAKPVVDQHQFQSATAALIREAARSVGNDLFHKDLDKLFPGMPKK